MSGKRINLIEAMKSKTQQPHNLQPLPLPASSQAQYIHQASTSTFLQALPAGLEDHLAHYFSSLQAPEQSSSTASSNLQPHHPPPTLKSILRPTRSSHAPSLASPPSSSGRTTDSGRRIKWGPQEVREFEVASEEEWEEEGLEEEEVVVGEVDQLEDKEDSQISGSPTSTPPSSCSPPFPPVPLPPIEDSAPSTSRHLSPLSSTAPLSPPPRSSPALSSTTSATTIPSPSVSTSSRKRKRSLAPSPSPPPPPVIVEGEEHYELESILRMERRDGKRWYEVKWVGYKETTWEPRRNVRETEVLGEWIRGKKERQEKKKRRVAVEGSPEL